jgi:hypothetical protein
VKVCFHKSEAGVALMRKACLEVLDKDEAVNTLPPEPLPNWDPEANQIQDGSRVTQALVRKSTETKWRPSWMSGRADHRKEPSYVTPISHRKKSDELTQAFVV